MPLSCIFNALLGDTPLAYLTRHFSTYPVSPWVCPLVNIVSECGGGGGGGEGLILLILTLIDGGIQLAGANFLLQFFPGKEKIRPNPNP